MEISARNQLRGTVTNIARGSVMGEIEVDFGGQKVTASIMALYTLAAKEGDVAAQIYLQWFVTEQVEEEKTVTDLIEQLKLSGDQAFAVLFMDKHVLGARS